MAINPLVPPTGLIGSEEALQQGLTSQLGLISQGVGSAQAEIDIATAQARGDIANVSSAGLRNIGTGFNQATEVLNPFTAGGSEAANQQAALSGAFGPEAQAQALQGIQSSPANQFALDQGIEARLRAASATGGLGGGNIQRELTRFGIGETLKNQQQQFNNLGTIAGRGLDAASQQAGLRADRGLALGTTRIGQGNILSGISQNAGVNLSNLALQGGLIPAQAVGNTADQLAQGRFSTGQSLAAAAGTTAANQANLTNQLGQGLASQFGQGATNIANIVSGAGTQSAQLQQNLATILSSIGTGTAANTADLTSAAAQFDASGILGQNTAVQSTLSQLLQLIPQGGGSDTAAFGGSDAGN